jgi:hypothetical protein
MWKRREKENVLVGNPERKRVLEDIGLSERILLT